MQSIHNLYSKRLYNSEKDFGDAQIQNRRGPARNHKKGREEMTVALVPKLRRLFGNILKVKALYIAVGRNPILSNAHLQESQRKPEKDENSRAARVSD